MPIGGHCLSQVFGLLINYTQSFRSFHDLIGDPGEPQLQKSAGPFHHASVPAPILSCLASVGCMRISPLSLQNWTVAAFVAVVLVLYIYYIYIWKMIWMLLLLFKKDSNDAPVKMGNRSYMSHRFKVISLTCLQKQSNGERDNQHQNRHWVHQRLWVCFLKFLCKLWI